MQSFIESARKFNVNEKDTIMFLCKRKKHHHVVNEKDTITNEKENFSEKSIVLCTIE